MPRIWNKRHKDHPEDAVYVGRPTRWGNPFISREYSLEESLKLYREWVEERINSGRYDLAELKGQDLVCWCAPAGGMTVDDPLVCHAQILVALANGLPVPSPTAR